jgi:chromosome segregation ATPase
MDHIDEAAGAVSNIADSVNQRVQIITDGQATLEEQASEVAAMNHVLNEIISATANQGMYIEQDLIALVDVIQFLSVQITMISMAGMPTSRIQSAVQKAQELYDKLMQSVDTISNLGQQIAPINQSLGEIAQQLAHLVSESENTSNQLSDVYEFCNETIAEIEAVGNE